MISVVLLGFIVNSVQQIHAERKQLKKIEEILVRKQNLAFVSKLGLRNDSVDRGGMTEAEFILSILEHLGTVDHQRDIVPWSQVTSLR